MTNDSSDSYVFLNDQILPRDMAKVSAFDRGFLYGDGIFETMRSYRGVLFGLDDHLRRLYESAQQLRINITPPREDLAEAARELLRINRLHDAYVRISLTRGQHAGSLAVDTGQSPTLLIDCRPVRAYPEGWYTNGVRIITSVSRRSRSALAPRHKCLSYIENILILNQARAEDAQEALILTDDGYVCEGATSNIFWTAAGNIYTPSPETNLLCGITRAVVIEICTRLGLQINEGLFAPDELARADEVFITNSIMEIMPVAAIDGGTVRQCPGEMATMLREEYAAEVKRCVEEAQAG